MQNRIGQRKEKKCSVGYNCGYTCISKKCGCPSKQNNEVSTALNFLSGTLQLGLNNSSSNSSSGVHQVKASVEPLSPTNLLDGLIMLSEVLAASKKTNTKKRKRFV